MLSLRMSQVAYQAGAYHGLCRHKEYLFFPLDGMLVHRRVITPPTPALN